MWELDHKESWVPKNWCFWTVVLEKTRESPLDSKEIKPVNLTGNQLYNPFEGRMLKLKLQYLGHRMLRTGSLEKTLMLGKIEGRRRRQWEWDGWMELPIWWTWVWTIPGVGDGQGNLACCSPWGCKESNTTEWLNWTESVPAPWSQLRKSMYDRQRPEPCRLYVVTWLTPHTLNLHWPFITSKSCVIFCKFLNLSVPEILHLWNKNNNCKWRINNC